SSSLRTSPTTATPLPPAASTSATAVRTVPGSLGCGSAVLASSTTLAPCLAALSAMASPMPRLPPETTSVRSVNVDMGLLDRRADAIPGMLLGAYQPGIGILILGKSHNRCVPAIQPPKRRYGAPRSVHVSAERYWHSHFLQVRYPLMTDPVQTPSGIPLEPVYGPADRAGEP